MRRSLKDKTELGGYSRRCSSTIKRKVTSSTEAECSALTKENSWQREVYRELRGLKEIAPTVYGDNTACISLPIKWCNKTK